MTRSVTLPIKSFFKPVRPWLPKMIISTLCFRASCTIASSGSPERTLASTGRFLWFASTADFARFPLPTEGRIH